MPRLRSNGIELEYVRSGPTDGEPLLMIHGVGAQLIRWPPGLIARLEAAAFDIVRFDNRDVGLSTHMDGAPIPDLAVVAEMAARGEPPCLPYTLTDMARDAIGLLDGLGIDAAHLIGVSLGGMIAQIMAIEQPTRVRSLAILMSSSGATELPGSTPSAIAALAARPPDPEKDMPGFLANALSMNRVLGSPAYSTRTETLTAFAQASAEHSYDPDGVGRQLAAGRGALDRRAALRRLDVPTLVIHGCDDPLIPLEAGMDIARQVKRAWLLSVGGMGHDLPDPLHDVFAAAITANARRSAPDAQ